MNNLEHCNSRTRTLVNGILKNPAVHSLTKDIIRAGLEKDSLDAVVDTGLALKTLKTILEDLIS